MSVGGVQIDPVGATVNQVLKFDGTKFAPGTDSGLAGTVYTSTIGDGTTSTFTVTHSLGTRDVVVVARNAASPYEVIDVRWEATTTGTVTLDFSAAPSASSVRVGVYAAVAGSTINTSLASQTDVTLTSSANGDFLRYNGTVWVNDAVNLSTDTIGDYVSSLVAGTGITLSNNTGEGATPTVAVTSGTYDAYGAAASAQSAAQTFATNLVANVATAFEIAGDSGTSKTITSGSDTLTIAGGVGLTSVTSVTDTITLNLDNTAVTAGNYGNSSSVGTFTVDAQGRLTAASNSAIAITASQVTDLTKSSVGLGNVDNTADTAKPVSTAQQTALDLKANLASPTFTGTVSGITATMVGLGNVDNTADTAKPVSTAQQTALDLKANLASPTFTGTTTTTGDLVVGGDLTVNGDVTTFNTATLSIEDNIIVLNNNVTGAPALNAGIEVERGTSDNVGLRWNETTDKWTFTNDGTNYANLGDVTAAALIAAAGGDGTNGQALTTNGSGTLDFTTIIGTTEASIISAVGADGANGSVLMTNGSGDLTFTTLTAAKISDFTANTRAQISVSGDLAYNSSTGVISFTNDAGDIESVLAGTGLSGGGTSGVVTLNLASTAVTAGNYGSSSSVGTFTVDAQGRLTAASNSAISITASQVSDFTEAAQDAVEGAITAGTGVTKAYNDGANTISLSIGQDVATSAAVTFDSIATGAITLDSGTGELNTSTQAISVNTVTTVDSFTKTAYRTAKYLIQASQGSKYTSSEVLLVHDGTDSYLSEYAMIELGASRIPMTVSTSISGSNVLLRVTVTDAASTGVTVKVARTLIAV